jgi:starch-binding outer membrane protein, SusD/RagB family
MKFRSFLIPGLTCLVCLVSCSKNILNITPATTLSDATVFTDSSTAYLFLNNIYNDLNPGPFVSNSYNSPSEIGNEPLDEFSDNACYGPEAGTLSYSLFNNDSYGSSTAAQIFNSQWTNMYVYIRACNLFIEKVTAANFQAGTTSSMIAQARFLRAYFYKNLIDLYGGVPIITKVLDNETQGDSIFYPRSSYDSCVFFIQNECTQAAANLPLTVSGVNIGKATQGAALALKGEEELYAGKWQDAAATNMQIMQSGVYSLFPDYVGLFYMSNEDNPEVVFDIQYAANIKPRHNNQYWGVVDVAKGAGWGDCGPTQDLVDDFQFIDGKTAAEGSAYYDPANPYNNREKRFYASIIYDGCIWRGTPVYTRLGIANNVNQINVVGLAGNSGRTGYFVRKIQDSTIPSTPSTLDGTNVIVWRYAEVLLNYAEAQNELSGPDPTVYSAINLVRTRAGLPNVPVGLDQDSMRSVIRHERRIELAFEGKRFYDIRRWQTAPQIFSQPIHGMEITTVNGQLNYAVIPIRTVTFNPARDYLQPIPQTVLDQNPQLTQNPGY